MTITLKSLALVTLSFAALPALADSRMSLLEIATQDQRFTTLVTALQATGLDQAVAGATAERPLTVFAPSNEAFAKLDPQVLEFLLKNPDRLANIIKLHVVRGQTTVDSLVLRKRVPTLVGFVQCPDNEGCVGSDGRISLRSATPFEAGNTVSISEEGITASNGIIHVIDAVLLPPQG